MTPDINHEPSSDINPESLWFGRKKVSPQEKTEKVLGVFDSVADRYDIMNDVMSAGLHRLWKNQLVRRVAPQAGGNYLDVAGGTGDIAFRLKKLGGESAHVTIADINQSMLTVGRARAIDRGYIGGFDWVECDAAQLPFDDHSFDVYTISFGLRNVTRIDDALREAWRVLKPGGRFFCLEFSHVDDDTLRDLYDFYSFRIIPQMGKWIAGDEASYQYLVESIRAFPERGALCQRLIDAGFGRAFATPLTFGVVAIHEAWKL